MSLASARDTTTIRRAIVALVLAGMALASLASCGGDSDASSDSASCSIEQSDLGPFSSDTPLGQSMSENQARARMADDNIVEWIAVTATGPWDDAWDLATASLGQGIHVDLTWLDVNGEISGLYEPGDGFEFTDLRVSRSFQGKIEHSDDPLYLPIQDNGKTVRFDAACSITALEFGDANDDQLLDVFDSVAISAPEGSAASS